MTYSAVVFRNFFRVSYKRLHLNDSNFADTFCANCVLIPWEAFYNNLIMDNHYTHSLGDFDYGFSLSKNGWRIRTSESFVGFCEYNSHKNTWLDNKLSIRNRILLKESVKGLPFKEWFYFLNKNFGLFRAVIFSVTPYMKILIKK